jgi:hypothetical protein
VVYRTPDCDFSHLSKFFGCLLAMMASALTLTLFDGLELVRSSDNELVLETLEQPINELWLETNLEQ